MYCTTITAAAAAVMAAAWRSLAGTAITLAFAAILAAPADVTQATLSKSWWFSGNPGATGIAS
jgi:hypothetical protein